MSAFIKKIPTSVKMIVAILSPIIVTVAALYVYGVQLRNDDKIYPNITIAGINVSGLTREEAMMSLGLEKYEQQSANASVTFIFPDESELAISGNDALLQHNAHDVVSQAHSIGRGHGVLINTISYLRRVNAEETAFYIDFLLDENVLRNLVTKFTDDYNRRLDAATPAVHEDHIVFTKGAGHINADVEEVYEFAYYELLRSLHSGRPIEILYKLPEEKIDFVDEIFEVRNSIFVQMVSSEYDLGTNSATECAVGVTFDTIEAARLVRNIEPGQTITFPLNFTHPEYTQEELDGLLFRDLIAERTTYAHGSESRINNITLASDAINGQILMPGEEFSFNETVGPRTAERGYKYAPALSQGETIMSIGGGICQVSSTIYASIRPSELLVTEQRKHGKPVPYLPWGWDATVFWNFIDFRFVNNTDYPLRIEVELDNRSLTARVWGTIKDDFPIAADWKD